MPNENSKEASGLAVYSASSFFSEIKLNLETEEWMKKNYKQQT